MTRRGQAAMEFLMTYGWAILVVLASVGALAYFGVLTPDTLLPERTVFSAPIQNNANAVANHEEGHVEVSFTNNVGDSIELTGDANITTDEGTCESANNITVLDESRTEINTQDDGSPASIGNGDVFLIQWDCGGNSPSESGERLNAEAEFDYENTRASQVRTHQGEIQARWG